MQLLLLVGLGALTSLVIGTGLPVPQCGQACVQRIPDPYRSDIKRLCSQSAIVQDFGCCLAKACSNLDANTIFVMASTFCAVSLVSLPKLSCASGMTTSTIASASSQRPDTSVAPYSSSFPNTHIAVIQTSTRAAQATRVGFTYHTPSSSPSAPPPQNNAPEPYTPGSLNGMVAIGCYTDSTSKRTLDGTSYTNSSGMGIDQCTYRCSYSGYPKYAGVEGNTCYCAYNDPPPDRKQKDNSLCNSGCSGASCQLALQVYESG